MPHIDIKTVGAFYHDYQNNFVSFRGRCNFGKKEAFFFFFKLEKDPLSEIPEFLKAEKQWKIIFG